MIRVPLSPSKLPGAPESAFVDSNCGWVRKWTWCVAKRGKTFYAVSWIEGRLIYMHRLIKPRAKELDHENGQGWDNQRTNLRTGTHAKNLANQRKQSNTSSRFKGVYWNKHASKWQAQIQTISARGKVYLGIFSKEVDAARAYDAAARKFFGKFARVNFP